MASETKIIANKYPSVLTDYTGMNEVMLNAEIAWGAIKEEAMIKEYVGIKNESMVLVEEAKEGFFESVKKFFRKIIESIKKIIINIKNKILTTLDYYGKFSDSAKKKFEKLGKEIKNKDVKTYDYGYINNIIEQSKKEVNEFKKDAMTIKTANNKEDINKTKENIEKLNMVDESEKRDQSININGIDGAINYLKVSKGYITDAAKIFNDAAKAAKDGENSANKEDKEAVELAKLKTTTLNSIGSKIINMTMKHCSICATYIKDCLKAVGASSTSEEKEKNDKSSAKKESYFGF